MLVQFHYKDSLNKKSTFHSVGKSTGCRRTGLKKKGKSSIILSDTVYYILINYIASQITTTIYSNLPAIQFTKSAVTFSAAGGRQSL